VVDEWGRMPGRHGPTCRRSKILAKAGGAKVGFVLSVDLDIYLWVGGWRSEGERSQVWTIVLQMF
jgi:hypothetical protein